MLDSSIAASIFIRSKSGMDLRVQIHASVDGISQLEWDALFVGSPEGWAFYRSGNQAQPPGFTMGAISVTRDGRTVAAAPVFRTVYRFDTSFQGRLRKIGDWLYRRLPSLVSMRVMGLGSPLSDHCHVGFDPKLSADQREEVMLALLDGFSMQAKRERIPLLAAKALTTPQSDMLYSVFEQRAYARVTSIPVVMLNLPFRNEAHYFASLGPSTASYLKRKLRPMDKLRIEHRRSIAGLEDQINALYKATLAQSPVDYGEFGHVHPDYFARVLANMGDKARFMLCWLGEELLSFQLYTVGDREIVAKCIGMRYPQAKEYNLYFINWMMMIRFALENDKSRICMGGTTYNTKMLFGGVIEKRWIHFRFRNSLQNAILPWLAPAFDFEKNDPELQALAAQQSKSSGAANARAKPEKASPRAADAASTARSASRPAVKPGKHDVGRKSDMRPRA